VVYELNDGSTRTVDWTVAKAGRVLDVNTNRKDGVLDVEEKTLHGTVTRSLSIRLDRVASVEQETSRA
jgi:hypothetical protein